MPSNEKCVGPGLRDYDESQPLAVCLGFVSSGVTFSFICDSRTFANVVSTVASSGSCVPHKRFILSRTAAFTIRIVSSLLVWGNNTVQRRFLFMFFSLVRRSLTNCTLT